MCVWILLKKKDKTKHAGYIHIGQDEQQHSISNLAGSRRSGLRSAPRLPSVKSITTDNTANIATVINVYIIQRHVFAVGNNNISHRVCVWAHSDHSSPASRLLCIYLLAR
jgi:hypothetical protein